mgnify:CR=1 FL=1
MNKKMRELLSQIEEKTTKAKVYLEDGDTEKANASLDEAQKLKEQYEAEKRLYEMTKETNTPSDKELEAQKEQKQEISSEKAFADAARRGFKATMTEGTNADGGYTVPEDIRTRVETYRDSKESLLKYVRVEKVATDKGARTFKARANQTGFTKVAEAGKIGAGATPTFERIEYDIDKYAAYYPVTNELLADSDANITNILTEWIGDESRVTANKLILEQIKTNTATEIKNGVDGIKKVLNQTLGSAFKPTSKIFTNDDGLQYLDTLKDSDGDYLLQPNPTDPMKMQLCAGASVIPVVVIPNADMPTDDTTDAGSSKSRIPMIIGDLKEGIVYWDRQMLSLMMSTVASAGSLNAFEQDLTLIRAIEREDVTPRDKKAFVNGYISILTANK